MVTECSGERPFAASQSALVVYTLAVLNARHIEHGDGLQVTLRTRTVPMDARLWIQLLAHFTTLTLQLPSSLKSVNHPVFGPSGP